MMASFRFGLWLVPTFISLLSTVTALPSAPPIQYASNSTPALLSYSLPDNDNNSTTRAAEIRSRRDGFQYGPAVGAGPYSPTGSLGDARSKADIAILMEELTSQEEFESKDYAKANTTKAQYKNLTTLEDYTELYDHEWEQSTGGKGPALGLLTNYTQDLLFAMERLSLNPWAVRRLSPSESMPFDVPANVATTLAGQTANTLLQSGRMFYVDHRNQSALPRKSQYSANCDALFYISPVSGNFLPLAIRTNIGKNLVYTPADAPNDWLLAKMMFNVNDFFMGQWDHFARTHYVIEAVGLAAERSLSEQHPLSGLVERFSYGSFGFRPVGASLLTNPGAAVDKYFGLSGDAATTFANVSYFNGYAGAVQANYFYTNLQRRGLINSRAGPDLKHFPYYEDAKPIYEAMRSFTGAYVDSYYDSPDAIANDVELQAWLVEAVAAQAIDFPTNTTLRTPSDLADLLAHLGQTVSVSHHVVNLFQLLEGSAVLPFHPIALYKPPPETKGVTDVVPWLPGVDQALMTIALVSDFARPKLVGTNRTLVHMFDSEELLARSHPIAKNANEVFMEAMRARSEIIKERTFGADGLSQGMPFVWKALDPDAMPWNVAI